MKRLVKMAASMLSAAIVFSSGLFVTNSNAVTIPGTGYVIDTCFPDSAFSKYVHTWVDTDENGLLSDDELKAVTSINLDECYVDCESLQGIDKFVNLEYLSCNGCKLTRVDLSNNPCVRYLSCANNNISFIDVSKCKDLDTLICDNNALTNINVSNNYKLTRLECRRNQLTELDVPYHSYLHQLYCSDNQIKILDLTSLSGLEILHCYNNELDALYLGYYNSELHDVRCQNNNLPLVDISCNPLLVSLYNNETLSDSYTDKYYLKSPDYSFNDINVWHTDNSWSPGYINDCLAIDTDTSVRSVFDSEIIPISKEHFSDKNFRNYIVSEGIDVDYDGYLTSDEIAAVKSINCSNMEIRSLKGVEFFTNLITLECDYNELSSLIVSDLTELQTLSCFSNNLTYLNLSKNTNLISLDCSYNQLVDLDVTNNPQLVFFGCDGNKLTALDVSKNTNIDTLSCYDNELNNLDVSKNTNLIYLNCRENNLSNLVVSNNPLLKWLDCCGNQLTSLNISNNTKLEYLDCGDNQISGIDVSKNVALETFYCGFNPLDALVVTENTALKLLDCCANKLTSINLSKNTKLEKLYISGNILTNLDLSNNLLLRQVYCGYNDANYLLKVDIGNNQILKDLCENESLVHYFYDGDYLHTDTYAFVKYSDVENHIVDSVLSLASNVVLMENGEFVFGATTITVDPSTSTTPTPDSTVEPTPTEEPGGTVDPGTTTPITSEVTKVPTPTNNPTSAPVVDPTNAPTLEATVTVGPVPTSEPTEAPSKSVGSFVDRCYSVALGRDADEGGYNYWLDALNNGEICGAQAGYGFIFSGEYTNKETTNEEFVTDLYSMYFGRTPDEGGFNYWVGLLNSGASREEVFAGFANSTEFDNLCSDYGVVTGAYLVGVPVAQQGGVNSFVARLYNICLTRRPDQAGQAGWAQKLIAGEITGTTCAFGFVFSPEFIGKEPSNEEFVAYMYRAFFGREADEAGFTAWVSTLNGGGTYEDVFAGFSGSAEFANLCASYGIQA